MKHSIIILSFFFMVFSAKAQINYNNNNISGEYSGAAGSNNTITGNNSFAAGFETNINGHFSYSLGKGNTIVGMGALTLGSISESRATGGIAIGNKLKVTMPYSVVIGKGEYQHPLVNNISGSLMVGFQSDIPTFFVGPADGPGTVGKVGIGTTNPEALLDVQGDINLSGNILKNGSPLQLNLWNTKGSNLYYTDGNVGIGTQNPSSKLHISNGNLAVSEGISTLILSATKIGVDGGTVEFYHPVSGYNAIICEKIWAKDEIVVQSTSPWPDYVFGTKHKRMPLKELEEYILAHGKLPQIPSAETVKKEGQKLAETQTLLLEKIEELTLYIIELKKENEALKLRINKLEEK